MKETKNNPLDQRDDEDITGLIEFDEIQKICNPFRS